MARGVILDMDPGVDDALAIMLALRSPELRVEAITTVSGNVHVSKACRNALKILENMPGLRRRPEVAKGLSRPLFGRLVTAEHVFGRDGLGDSNLPEPEMSCSRRHAVDLIIERVMDSREGEITLITTGPLSNLAFALLREPELALKIPRLVMMGGAYGVTRYGAGNITPAAEFNIFADPEAAKIVLESGLPVTAVGLDVTADPSASLTRRLFERIRYTRTRAAELVTRLTSNHMAAFDSLALHDPLAVAVAVDPSLVTTREYPVVVETRGEHTRGQTVADRREPPPSQTRGTGNPVSVCTGVSGERFLDLFLERVIEG